MTPKIAIIGAGPGGLCLANILQNNDIRYTIFEGDNSPFERNQGGTLDLHPSYGQLAVREAGVWDDFCKYCRPEADVMKIVKIDGEVLWDGNGPDKHDKGSEPGENNKPEIDREKLKQIFLQNLEPENLRFGMHLQEVVSSTAEPGKYDLHFRQGAPEIGYDLIVGADGAWSKVRKLLTDTLPHYSGVSLVELWKSDLDSSNPWLSEYLGAGSCFSFSEGRAIMMQRLGDGGMRTYACVRKPETFLRECGIDFNNHAEARKQYVEQYFGDAGADLKKALLETDGAVVARALYMLPVGWRWEGKSGITLIGDAAHLMTPFAGVGVNAALSDALELAKAIIASASTNTPNSDLLHAAVSNYETEMFSRAEMFATRTFEGLVGHFSATGSEDFAKLHREHYAADR